MKVISFSLYGDSPKYIVGAAKNILLAREHYPGWVCRIYINQPIIIDWLMSELENESNKLAQPHSGKFQFRDGQEGVPPMIWRFMVADDPEVERFIIRDADSRIGAREAAAVQEWEQSGLLFHSCRDHFAHCREINGGMFGGVWRNHNWAAPKMIDLWNEWVKTHQNKYISRGCADVDQGFLCTMIWPWAKNSMLQLDSCCRQHFPGSKPFPTKRDWPRFMGEVFNEHDQPRDGDFQQISKDQE